MYPFHFFVSYAAISLTYTAALVIQDDQFPINTLESIKSYQLARPTALPTPSRTTESAVHIRPTSQLRIQNRQHDIRTQATETSTRPPNLETQGRIRKHRFADLDLSHRKRDFKETSATRTATNALALTTSKPSWVIAAVAKAAASPSRSDLLNFQNSIAIPASGTWTAIKCDATGLTDNSIPFDQQWKVAGADEAWPQLLAAWETNKQTGIVPQNFSDFAFNVFHYAPLSDCQNIDSTTCGVQVQCGNSAGAPPAAGLIINSIIAMHEIAKQQFIALASGVNAIQGQVLQMASTFAKQPPKDISVEVLKVLLDVLTLGIGIASAFVWNVAFDAFKVLASNTPLRGALKDSFNAGVAFAFVTQKDVLKPAKDDSGTSETLQGYVSDFYTQLQAVNTAYIYSLMAGNNNETLTQLSGLVQGGGILDILQIGGNNIFNSLTDNVASLMYGRLIPAAWGISPKHYSPFILRVDKSQYTCGDDLPNSSRDTTSGIPLGYMMTKDTANKTSWCDPEGNSWFLLTGQYSPPCPQRFCTTKGPGDMPFQAMDGGDRDTLDGTQWGHFKLEDIFISAYTGFLQNGQANGYQLNDTSSGVGNDDFTISDNGSDDGLVLSGGVRTPGFFNFTICLDAQEAYTTLTSTWSDSDHSAPICARHPQAGGTRKVGAPGSWSAGTCGVHVTQYQRNEKNLNLLSVYQISVIIADANNRIIGTAAKQASHSPLIVADTVLPYALIVATPGPEDDDAVQFWYADQWWTSNDQGHRCDFGKYDNGVRQGDCIFRCPLHDSNAAPPQSATITAPLPGTPRTAIPGAEIFTNTFTTSTSTSTVATADATSTPSPSPTPGYKTGRCSFHMTQHQRHEPDNPTNDFQLEITLFDASHPPAIIGNSGLVQAPTGQAVPVKGRLLGTLWLTTQVDDNDAVLFGYDGGGGKNYTSDRACRTGAKADGYQDGKREFDCGFSCDP